MTVVGDGPWLGRSKEKALGPMEKVGVPHVSLYAGMCQNSNTWAQVQAEKYLRDPQALSVT